MAQHCWKDYRTHLEETGKSYSPEWVQTYYGTNRMCMSERDHEGDHEFIDGNLIEVTFSGDSVTAKAN